MRPPSPPAPRQRSQLRSGPPRDPRRGLRSNRRETAAARQRTRRWPGPASGHAACAESALLPRIPLPSLTHRRPPEGPYEGRTTIVSSTGVNAVTLTGWEGWSVLGSIWVVQLPPEKTSSTYGPPIGTPTIANSPEASDVAS